MIVGIDEVGRGPWAGPLVVGAVVLGCEIGGLTDSKKLTKKRREALNAEIMDKAASVGLGWVSASEIDEWGLSRALTEATKRALLRITVPYHEIIIDGTVNFLAETGKGRYVTTMKKADLLIPSVSAASIVAKVARDSFMAQQDDVFPGYNFKSHVGYGTAAHRAALEKLGACQLHRMSFAPLEKYRVQAPRVSQKHARSRRAISPKPSLASAELPVVKQSSKRREVFGKIFGTSRSAPDAPAEPAAQTSRSIGDSSETVAAEELVRRGHEIIARNWKTKYCEVDIISQKRDTLYFTEVKHRKNARSGDGLAAITPKKLNQMKFAAKFYAHSQKLENANLRLVAIATTGDTPAVTEVVEIE